MCCQVSNYHKEFYRPENLCVVITGQVDATQVFPAVRPFKEKIVSKVDWLSYQTFTPKTFLCGRLSNWHYCLTFILSHFLDWHLIWQCCMW